MGVYTQYKGPQYSASQAQAQASLSAFNPGSREDFPLTFTETPEVRKQTRNVKYSGRHIKQLG